MPQAAQSTGGFGSGTTNLFSQGQQQQQSTNMGSLPQQSTGTPFFTKSTKFNDLPDNVKKAFEDIDGHIQGRIHIGKELKQRKLADQATKGQDLIRETRKELGNATTTLHSDYRLTKDLKLKVDQSVQDTIVAIRIIDGFRNPQQHGAHLKNYATFPLEFFERITLQMRERLKWYKATIEQIERKLTSASSQAQSTPQAIASSLEAQHATFVYLANKTAVIDAELQKIKALYRQLWRAKTGSMRDPFNELDRGNSGDFGLDGLTV